MKKKHFKKIHHLGSPTKLTQKIFFWCLGSFLLTTIIILLIGAFSTTPRTDEIVLSGLSGKNQIALTFNVGKDVSTEQIISLTNSLLTAKIPCTFFVPQGGVEELFPVWQAQTINGNEIAYFYDGINFDAINPATLTSSFTTWETYVQKNIDPNLTATYIRAGNNYDYKNLYVQMALAQQKAYLIGWSIEFKDMAKIPLTDLKKVLKEEVMDGAIIKMDISDYNTATLIKLLGAEAKTKKLTFVVLNKMFES
jgi:hypothetical protein